MNQFKTPILFLIFNRPEVTLKTLLEIKKINPPKLYIAADGPRTGKNEEELCQKTRELVQQHIQDLPQVYFLYRDQNLGCKKAVSEAIHWFFEQEEMGIILEDDCLPNQDFFKFCQAMLLRYKDQPQIMHIGGTNFQQGKIRGEGAYYYSRIAHVWGWATWRRAWKHYSIEMPGLDTFLKNNQLKKLFPGNFWQLLPFFFQYRYFLLKTSQGLVNTWDFQWVYTIWNQAGLAIIPNHNLVTNIGYGEAATHTSAKDQMAEIPSQALSTFKAPQQIAQHLEADVFFARFCYGYAITLSRIWVKLKQVLFKR